jgi:GNAT superfamily N-acetyltransferase
MIVRQAVPGDAAAMADLLNAIIRIGGTTAHERELGVDRIMQHYITGPAVICCHVAVRDRRLIGFQSLDRNDKLPDGWGDIGTFVAPDTQRSGAGLHLFEATCVAARAAGVATINATIRADNAPGLGYYTRRGFQDYAADPDYRLSDGMRVGRMSKRFDLV